MKWSNDTGQPAGIFRSELGSKRMACSILARVRHVLTPEGQLLVTVGDAAPQDLRRDRIEDEYGVIEPDLPFPRTGTDVIMVADASPPGYQDVACEVGLELGPYHQRVLVVGDRIWEPGGRSLQPSAPTPFSTLPLTWSRAYGGRTTGAEEFADYGPVVNAANPVGRGYYLHEQFAVGGPLPNIEEPTERIHRWDDRPEPVGFAPYPANWGLRLDRVQRCTVVDGKVERIELIPEGGMFDRAHPRLSGQQVPDNAELRVSGTSFAPLLNLRLPAAPFEVELCLGARCFRRAMRLEEVLLDLRAGWLELSYRKIFNYEFVAHQQRRACLIWVG